MEPKISGNDDPNESFNNIQMSKLIPELSAILRNCDRILYVEGPTDVRFYYFKYAPKGFFFTNSGSEIVGDAKNLFSNLGKSYRWNHKEYGIERSLKEKIEILIKDKKMECGDSHFYGIVDKDYDGNSFADKDYIMVTDANSLETMLLEYACEKEQHLQFLKLFFKNRTNFYSSFSDKIIEQIYSQAMYFALQIGCLRKEKGGDAIKRFDFSSMLRGSNNDYFGYFAFCAYKKNRFKFDFDMYCERLLDLFMQNNKIPEEYKTDESISKEREEINNIIANAKAQKGKEFDLCQGHDVVALIDVMGCRYLLETEIIKNIYEYTQRRNDAGFAFIDAFDIKWFEGSPIDKWLFEKNKEVQKVPKTTKFGDFIIPVSETVKFK